MCNINHFIMGTDTFTACEINHVQFTREEDTRRDIRTGFFIIHNRPTVYSPLALMHIDEEKSVRARGVVVVQGGGEVAIGRSTIDDAIHVVNMRDRDFLQTFDEWSLGLVLTDAKGLGRVQQAPYFVAVDFEVRASHGDDVIVVVDIMVIIVIIEE